MVTTPLGEQRPPRAGGALFAVIYAASAGLFLTGTGTGCAPDCVDPYCYAPYVDYYYLPDYPDWTFWYDDTGWWVVDSGPYDVDSGSAVAGQPATGYDELKELKHLLAGSNGAVVSALAPVKELEKLQPSSLASDTRQYGPADLPAGKPVATFKLTVTRGQSPNSGWRLVAKPIAAADSAYQTVLQGGLANPSSALPGAARAEFNLDALHAVDKVAYPATGRIVATKSADAAGQTVLAARLYSCSFDGKMAPQDASVSAEISRGGTRQVRWRTTEERIAGTPDKGPEQVREYLTWIPNQGGRIYTLLKNGVDDHGMPQGDLPPDTYLLGQSCYAPDAKPVYKAWYRCGSGTPAQCLEAAPELIETPGKSAADCPLAPSDKRTTDHQAGAGAGRSGQQAGAALSSRARGRT